MNPKYTQYCEQIALNISNYRQKVLKLSYLEFANRLNKVVSQELFDEQAIITLETNPRIVNADTLLCAFMVMQVLDLVTDASKAQAALYIASSQLHEGIEDEMIKHLNKKG